MAVVDKYANADLEAGKQASASTNGGSGQFTPYLIPVAIAAGDDDGSVYRLFRVNSQNTVKTLDFGCTAITGGTSYSFGLYETEPNGGAAVDDNIFLNGASMVSATSGALRNGLGSVAMADRAKSIAELLGLTRDPNKEYDLCLKATTIGSVDGTVFINAEII